MLSQLKTLYLFTRSDFKSILLPIVRASAARHRPYDILSISSIQMLFACAGAASLELGQFLRAFFWLWLHLLQFCVSNQSLSPEEDAQNKPFRPIPSRRITVAQARKLRWALIPICLMVSAAYGVFAPGVTLAVHFLLHNELQLDANWITRNVLNALGYCAFDAGASAILGVFIVPTRAPCSTHSSPQTQDLTPRWRPLAT